jgi:hypothetical protein
MAAVPLAVDPVVDPVDDPVADPLEEVHQAFILCGIEDPLDRARIIMFEGINTLAFLGMLTEDELDRMVVRLAKHFPANTRVVLGMAHIKRLKTIMYWVQKLRRQGHAPDINMIVDAGALDDLTLEMDAAKPTKADEKLFYPQAFEAKKYIMWNRSLANYLDSQIGKANVPLSYITRPDDVNPEEAIDEYQRLIWSAPHQGFAFNEDNRQVYRIYKDLVTGTDGWAWFSMAPEGNGRAVHQRMERHYLGDDANARRAAQAKAQMDRLHYKNESVFPFERYVTILHECFEALDDNNQGLNDAHKVNKLLEGVQSTNPEVIALKTVIRATHPTDFNAASTHMAQQIAMIFPAANISEARVKRRVANVETGARGRGRFGNRNAGRNLINGVDVSNPTRNFTDDEWKKLRDSGMMAWIISRRQTRSGGGRGYRGGRGGRAQDAHGGREARAGQRNAGAGRRVNAAAVRFADDEPAANDENPQNGGRGGQNGARFGGRRHGGG